MSSEYFIHLALQLAARAHMSTLPNPRVGCIIVKDGKIISTGYHRYYGDYHAERHAFLNNSVKSFKNAELYVNLEPCAHVGKQPPCVDLIVHHQIKHVYYSLQDPDPKVNGVGKDHLMRHNIGVSQGILVPRAWDINEDYLYQRVKNRPLVIGKWATSIDGKLFYKNNEQTAITNNETRLYAHVLRNKYQAIMIGANTLKVDNPLLTINNSDIKNPYNPIKIIVSTNGDISSEAKLFQDSNNKVIVVTTNRIAKEKEALLLKKGISVIKTSLKNNQVDLSEMLVKLAELGILSIYVEGGAKLLGNLLIEDLIDRLYVFVGNIFIGGRDNTVLNDEIKNGRHFNLSWSKVLKDDVLLCYNNKKYLSWRKENICLQESLNSKA